MDIFASINYVCLPSKRGYNVTVLTLAVVNSPTNSEDNEYIKDTEGDNDIESIILWEESSCFEVEE